MRWRRSGETGGFTLVEVLVAFAIAALGLAGLFEIFATGLRNAGASEAFARAVMLAETRLAAVGVEQPLEAGESYGDLGEGYSWHTVIAPYYEKDMNTAIETFVVSVTVSWGADTSPPTAVTLQTLRLGRAQ